MVSGKRLRRMWIKMIRMIRSSDNELDRYLKALNSQRGGIPPEVARSVAQITERVRQEGDSALLGYTLEFDGVNISARNLRVTQEEMDRALEIADSGILAAISKAAANIRSFHERQKEQSWFFTGEYGEILGQRITPVRTAGIYVPGGTAPLFSSVLMNAIPAAVAGVERIVMATPPCEDGSVNPVILAAAREAGVDEVYRMGGAQAVAAMAYGTETVPQVDKIAGPGNVYVSAAKKMVFGTVGIDMVAGPSEITVLADETANPAYVAADMLSQAEHDERAASILVTFSRDMADSVLGELERQCEGLKRKETALRSLKDFGAIIILKSMDEAVEVVNCIAPEHLELCVKEPFCILGCIRNAGAVFMGQHTPEAVGDYYAGPSHVLPTGGTARFFSPLGVYDFVKRTGMVYYTKGALENASGDIMKMAGAEGLDAHANSAGIRTGDNK